MTLSKKSGRVGTARKAALSWAVVPIALIVPVGGALVALVGFALMQAANATAWRALFEAHWLLQSVVMTLWTGLAATLCSWSVCAWLLSRAFGSVWWPALVRRLGTLLALPHAGFAIGFVFLVAPSGWILRAISPWLTGFNQPPHVASSQDEFGLGLIAVLTLKEVPFLLWCAASQLQRDDAGALLLKQTHAASSLGYSSTKSFWTVVWPQLRLRLRWPLFAVLSYNLTVVDAALIAGPSTPATMSVRAWQWLQDAAEEANAIGAVAAWSLAFVVALATCAAALWLCAKRDYAQDGDRGSERWASIFYSIVRALWCFICAMYLVVFAITLIGSASGLWPFPAFVPQSLSWQAWRSVGSSAHTLWLTLGLGVASAGIALVWCVAWLECAPAKWDARARPLLCLPLLLPSVLWVTGLHRFTLSLHISGHAIGLLVAHVLVVLPYVIIALAPAYQKFDARFSHISYSLGKSHALYLLKVKWPVLRAALLSAFAVGFAVSVAQFLPTLTIGEGRFETVTSQAVTLASGGQRSLTAAYAALQWLLPALMFMLAAWLGAPRWMSR